MKVSKPVPNSVLSPSVSVGAVGEGLIHVLHVDDESRFLEVIELILEQQGSFQVECASSVEKAFVKLGKREFDVVVSDYQMPIKDGLQFLRELRARGNNIPFILFIAIFKSSYICFPLANIISYFFFSFSFSCLTSINHF